ncbi:MAG TPA: flavoprotein [Rhizomicrobium sp.]|nr:flavoprotein [Rhizomicrobium sp.]
MKDVLLGCTGSVSVLSVPFLVLDLMLEHKADVQVVMTPGAEKFVTAYSFEVLTGKPVVTDVFSAHTRNHISLVRACSVFLIAPATANTLSKVACGIADNIVTMCAAVCMGSDTRLVMAPSMNPSMWKNPALQHNLKLLESRGVTIVPPRGGICIANKSEEGETAMAGSDAIIETLQRLAKS